jgi:hypothetical protein
VVGNDDVATEGTWGTDGIGSQRGDGVGLCGVTARDNTGVCPAATGEGACGVRFGDGRLAFWLLRRS